MLKAVLGIRGSGKTICMERACFFIGGGDHWVIEVTAAQTPQRPLTDPRDRGLKAASERSAP